MRPTWKGSLKLSLIHIPIRVFAATTAGADVAFHMVHRKCHTRIEMRRWCPHCHQQVESDDVARAYERSKGRFVLVEQEEISAVRPDTTQVIDISDVVDRAAVDPEMIERAYFLAPDTRKDGPAFAVVRGALEDRSAVGHLAMHGRSTWRPSCVETAVSCCSPCAPKVRSARSQRSASSRLRPDEQNPRNSNSRDRC
ncbi:MAG: hypothetical protein KAY59_01875 [Acidobacteria bacterium]|nr:hypothetical protein [Acidobacteriota bacterium]